MVFFVRGNKPITLRLPKHILPRLQEEMHLHSVGSVSQEVLKRYKADSGWKMELSTFRSLVSYIQKEIDTPPMLLRMS